VADLRSELERARDAISPPPDAFGRLVDRRRRRRRAQRLGAAAVALVLAGTGIGLAARAFLAPSPGKDRPSEAPETREPGPVAPRVTARVTVGPSPLGLAAGEGAVWAVTQPGKGPSELVRVDPGTNEVVARAPYEGHPLWFAAGAGAVWAVRTADGPDEVLRIDPTSLEITARVAVGEFAGPVTAGPEGVWVVVRDRAKSPPSLTRIDPPTGEVLSTVPLGGIDGVIDVELAGSSVWVRGWEGPDRARGCARVIRVDPGTVSVVQDLVVEGPVQPGPGGLRFAGGQGTLWVNCRERRAETFAQEQLFAVGIDAGTGTAGSALSLPAGVFWPIGASPDGVWFGGFEADERPLLVLLDPGTHAVRASIDPGIGGVESAMYDPATESIWVPESRGGAGALLRIDLRR
jgi:hypothetical protein